MATQESEPRDYTNSILIGDKGSGKTFLAEKWIKEAIAQGREIYVILADNIERERYQQNGDIQFFNHAEVKQLKPIIDTLIEEDNRHALIIIDDFGSSSRDFTLQAKRLMDASRRRDFILVFIYQHITDVPPKVRENANQLLFFSESKTSKGRISSFLGRKPALANSLIRDIESLKTWNNEDGKRIHECIIVTNKGQKQHFHNPLDVPLKVKDGWGEITPLRERNRSVKKGELDDLLKAGIGYDEIANKTGYSKGTIYNRASTLGITKRRNLQKKKNEIKKLGRPHDDNHVNTTPNLSPTPNTPNIDVQPLYPPLKYSNLPNLRKAYALENIVSSSIHSISLHHTFQINTPPDSNPKYPELVLHYQGLKIGEECKNWNNRIFFPSDLKPVIRKFINANCDIGIIFTAGIKPSKKTERILEERSNDELKIVWCNVGDFIDPDCLDEFGRLPLHLSDISTTILETLKAVLDPIKSRQNSELIQNLQKTENEMKCPIKLQIQNPQKTTSEMKFGLPMSSEMSKVSQET